MTPNVPARTNDGIPKKQHPSSTSTQWLSGMVIRRFETTKWFVCVVYYGSKTLTYYPGTCPVASEGDDCRFLRFFESLGFCRATTIGETSSHSTENTPVYRLKIGHARSRTCICATRDICHLARPWLPIGILITMANRSDGNV